MPKVKIMLEWEPKVDQIWPDGDWPEAPTSDDLRDSILKAIDDVDNEIIDFLQDWGLDEDLKVYVNDRVIWEKEREVVEEPKMPDWIEDIS